MVTRVRTAVAFLDFVLQKIMDTTYLHLLIMLRGNDVLSASFMLAACRTIWGEAKI
jgi:hypothetical protein